MKKIVIVLTILIILIGIYFIFVKKDSTPKTISDLINLFPYSDSYKPNTPSQEKPSEGVDAVESKGGTFQIFSDPISDFSLLRNGSSTNLIFLNRSTGNIYNYSAQTKTNQRLTNTSLVNTSGLAGFIKNDIIYLYIKQNVAWNQFVSILRIPLKNLEEDKISSSAPAIIPNITDFQVGKDFITTEEIVNDKMLFSSFMADLTGREEILLTPHKTWIIQPVDKKTVFLNTLPAVGIKSFSYITSENKSLRKLIPPQIGLMSKISPNKENIVYSLFDNGSIKTYIFKKSESKHYLLNIKTLVDKCVWAEDSSRIFCGVPKYLDVGSYPQSWYAGEITFTDNIVGIDIQNPSVISTFIKLPKDIDIEKIIIDPDNKSLYFKNKKDSTIWTAELAD